MKHRAILILCLLCLGFQLVDQSLWQPAEHFPETVYPMDSETLSQEKVDLGRALFYDPILSRDQSVSCASCHSPYHAFAHTDHDLSHGIDDQIGLRNAPALFNLAWRKSFMWDGAVNHLDVQALAPITDAKEMDETMAGVIDKLQASSLYRNLFYRAFGDSMATGEHLLKAIAQFQLTLVSDRAKYDQVKQGLASFTTQEENGYRLFQQNCASCHTEPLFTNDAFANNGLPVDTTLNDLGRWMRTQNPSDSLTFKVPSLRNLSYTYPYMHDGRFQKLQEVINHYTDGISESPTLAHQLQKPIVLTAHEKVDLVAFLLTLNDEAFVLDPDHKYPRHILLQSSIATK